MTKNSESSTSSARHVRTAATGGRDAPPVRRPDGTALATISPFRSRTRVSTNAGRDVEKRTSVPHSEGPSTNERQLRRAYGRSEHRNQDQFRGRSLRAPRTVPSAICVECARQARDLLPTGSLARTPASGKPVRPPRRGVWRRSVGYWSGLRLRCTGWTSVSVATTDRFDWRERATRDLPGGESGAT